MGLTFFTNKKSCDIDHLFYKTTYYHNDKEISEQEYEKHWDLSYEERDGCYDQETEEFDPSLKHLLDLVPSGVKPEEVYLSSYIDHGDYGVKTIQDIGLFYTTPYIYEDELKKYNEEFAKYEKAMIVYKEKQKEYKIKMEEYKAEQEKIRLDKKKAALKAQLEDLEK